MKSLFITLLAITLGASVLAQTSDETPPPLATPTEIPTKAGALATVVPPTFSDSKAQSPARPIVSTDAVQFTLAMKEYQRISDKPEALDYFKNKFYPYFSEAYTPVLKACFDKKIVPAPSYDPFIFLITLDKTGHALAINLDKATTTSDCLMKKLATDTLPPPPFAPFTQKINMNFR